MSEDLEKLPVETVEVPTVDEGNGVATILVAEVKDLVAKSQPEVRERVVKHLVGKQLEERADLILKGLDKRTALQKDLQKCRPDQKTRTGDGKVEERFSEAKWKEKNDLEEKLKKLEKALEEAVGEKANYELLKKAIS